MQILPYTRFVRRLLTPIKREDLTFIAVDTETTGLDPSMCGITEVGWQPVERGVLLPAMSFITKPAFHGNPGRCIVDEDQICKDNYQRSLDRALGFGVKRAMECVRAEGQRLYDRTGARPYLVFHNAPFDVAFLSVDHAFTRDSLRWLFQESEGPFSRRMFDTQAMVQPLVMRGEVKSAALKSVCETLGVRPGDHTAGEDARATAECLIELLTGGWV